MDKHIIETALANSKTMREAARSLKTSFSNFRYWIAKHKIDVSAHIQKSDINRYCPRCEQTKKREEFYCKRGKEGSSSYCKICTNAETTERQRKFKHLCVEYKGGKCIHCGYNKCIGALDFHHRNPAIKEFSISMAKHHSFLDNIKEELDKCDLVCSNCHREIHDKIQLKRCKLS